MAAIEKGMEVPALPVELLQVGRRSRTPADYLRRGVMLLLIGIAVTVALYVRQRDASVWGLVPCVVGIAYLLFYWLEVRKPTRLDRQ
jgi:di/tricarboxylate transporter